MSRKWLYFPFRDISQDPTMPGNKERYEKKYGSRLIVKQKGDERALEDIADDEMLIIAGHGLPNSNRIGVTTNKGQKRHIVVTSLDIDLIFTDVEPIQVTMTANDLADELEGALLPRTHKYIKLITCGGAGMIKGDDANAKHDGKVVTAMPIPEDSHAHMAECLASVLAKSLGIKKYYTVMVKGYPGFVNAMNERKTVTIEGTSVTSQEKKQQKTLNQQYEVMKQTNEAFAEKWADDVRPKYGVEYWKKGTVGMISNIPTKLVNDYWFDSKGELKRQHISLKPGLIDNIKSFFW